MNIMDKDYAIKMHRELWTWLSENPEKHKWDWPKWKFHGGTITQIESDCFCCQYSRGIDGACNSSCPIVWPGGRCANTKDTGLYDLYVDAVCIELRSRFAMQIANLPENEDV